MRERPKRIMLTGGAGFIGSHLAEALLRRGAVLCIVDNLDHFYAPAWKKANLEEIRRTGRFEFFERDICEMEMTRETLAAARPEVIIHLAVRAGAGLGRAGRLPEHLASGPERAERTPVDEVEQILSGWESCSREKGSHGVGKTKRGKGTNWRVVVDAAGVPLVDHPHSASPLEVRLAETTLAAIRVSRPRQEPVRVIADKAYNRDPLRRRRLGLV